MCTTQCRPVFFGGFPNHPRRKNKLRILKKKLGNPIVHKPQNLEIALREVGHFQDDCATVRRLGDWGCFKKSTENKLINRCSDKQSESVNLRSW